jgi:hypothetical protein
MLPERCLESPPQQAKANRLTRGVVQLNPAQMSGAMECISVVSDSRNLAALEYNEFDSTLSHSMTADGGRFEDQRTRMCEVKRVGKRNLVQSPNY